MSVEQRHIEIVPMTMSKANEIVKAWHRHHRPVPGCKFVLGAEADGQLVGVLIAGRPVARAYDDGFTIEVTRCATNGAANACSALYGAARRAAWALGFRRLITYTRTDESGASLRGAGWKVVAKREARSWASSSVSRPRTDKSEPAERLLWEAPS